MNTQIKPGKYNARILDYGIGTTKEGKPTVEILFIFIDADGIPRKLRWYGHLTSEKAKEITIDALLICGLKGDNLEVLADGLASGALDTERDVQVVVELDTMSGKPRIRWVNRLGGQAFKDRMSKNEAKLLLSGMNLKGEVAARRAETGIQDPSRNSTTKRAVNQDFTSFGESDEDMPF